MRKILFAILFAFSLAASAQNAALVLLDAATTAAAGIAFNVQALPPLRAVQVSGVTSAGAGAAVVEVQGSNNAVAGTWEVLGSVTLTLGTTRTVGSFVSEAPYRYLRGEVKSISGTDAAVTANVGVAQQ